MWNILAVEDDADFAARVHAVLAPVIAGRARITPATDLASAHRELSAERFDLLIVDMVFPLTAGTRPDARAGHGLLSELSTLAPGALVIVLSGQDPRDAVELLLARRVDAYVFKDSGLDEVKVQVERCLETLELRRSERLLRAEVSRVRGPAMIASGPAMLQLMTRAEQVAVRDTSVLITGESGTGKEVLARYIHGASPRRLKPFVALSCAAIPESLAEAELFGAVKGAYTGMDGDREGVIGQAAGGTLFLDEIGELPLPLQAKFLRALQEKSFKPIGATRERRADFRLLCATHRDLEKAVTDGRFREDLLYRIRVFPLHLPPLRERRDDLPALVAHLVQRFNQDMGRRIHGVSPAAMARLTAHSWPGNIRELANALEFAFVVESSDTIQATSLPALRGSDRADATSAQTHAEALEQFERGYLEAALQRCGGSVSRTAEDIRLPRRTLVDRLARLGLKPRPEPASDP